MPRAPRIDVGDHIYHVINRANGRQTIFHTPDEKERYLTPFPLTIARVDGPVFDVD